MRCFRKMAFFLVVRSMKKNIGKPKFNEFDTKHVYIYICKYIYVNIKYKYRYREIVT